MYYVYLDSPCGTELIGQAENLTKAKEIKAKKDKTWQREICGIHVLPKQKKKNPIFGIKQKRRMCYGSYYKM